MARSARVDVGNEVYHVLNRAVGRLTIFEKSDDYQLFVSLLHEAKEMTDMRILSFVLMPNHWHLQLYPRKDKELSLFMHWLTNAHTRRVHALTETIGTGPLYQGRYKSFLVQGDRHLLTVLKYIERNPVRAKLTRHVDEWRWGSAWIRQRGTAKQRALLSGLPTLLPSDYLQWVNTNDNEDDLVTLRGAVSKGTPFGNPTWTSHMIATHDIGATARKPGRPATPIL